MPVSHIAFASSAISSAPSSSQQHTFTHSSDAASLPMPLLQPARAPTVVSSSSNSDAYAGVFSHNFAPDSIVSRSGLNVLNNIGIASETASVQSRTRHGQIAPGPASSDTATTTPAVDLDVSPFPSARVTGKIVPARTDYFFDSHQLSHSHPLTSLALDAPATIVAAPSSSDLKAADSHAHSPFFDVNVPVGQASLRPTGISSSNGVADVVNPSRSPNRWSASTGSSRASVAGSRQLYHRHQRTASFSRRLSINSLGSSFHLNEFEPAPSPQQTQQSQRSAAWNLEKHQPATSSSGSSPLREREPPATSGIDGANGSRGAHSPRQRSPVRAGSPFASLPPIVALPPLEQEVQASSVSYASTAFLENDRPYLRQNTSKDIIQPFHFGDAQSSVSVPPAKLNMQYTREYSDIAPTTQTYIPDSSQNVNGSTDSTNGSKDRSSKAPSQKAMLSRALQKANMAVQLDNAGNLASAREAYAEACELLQQVLQKTPSEDDQRKLEAIKVTYTVRIGELDSISSTREQNTRPLLQRPSSKDDYGRSGSEMYSDRVHDTNFETGPEAMKHSTPSSNSYHDRDLGRQGPVERRPAHGYSNPQSFSSPRPIQSGFISPYTQPAPSLLNNQYTLQSTFSRSPRRELYLPQTTTANASNTGLASSLQAPSNGHHYIPPPLSPKRVAPPSRPYEAGPTSSGYETNEESFSTTRYDLSFRSGSTSGTTTNDVTAVANHVHKRTPSHESISWLDPINESGSSAASSVHSRTSSLVIRRKHIRAASGTTEAEFDAALDDAIEAAYDDGYEPMGFGTIHQNSYSYKDYDINDRQVSQSLRKVELAKERVRETEREAMAFERQLRMRGQKLHQQQPEETDAADAHISIERNRPSDFPNSVVDFGDEERGLEGTAGRLAMDNFAFGLTPTSIALSSPTREAVPHYPENDIFLPSRDANVNDLKTVSPPPTHALPQVPPQHPPPQHPPPQHPPPQHPPPQHPPPQHPPPRHPPPQHPPPQMPPPQAAPVRPLTSQGSRFRGDSMPTVRNRRLSGQNMNQLKIETTNLTPPFAPAGVPAPANDDYMPSLAHSASAALPQQPRTVGFLMQQRQVLSAGSGPGLGLGLSGAATTMIPAVPGIPSITGGSAPSSRPGSSAAGGSFVLPFSRQPPTPSSGTSATTYFGASPIEAKQPPSFIPSTPPIPQGLPFPQGPPLADSSTGNAWRAGSPSTGRPGLRKNFSSSSLRSLRSRNMSLTNLDGDTSPATPPSNQFTLSGHGGLGGGAAGGSNTRLPLDMPTLPAAGAVTYKDRGIMSGSSASGMRFLDSSFHLPSAPNSPGQISADAPVPLEPCPTDTMLRPFWLMRCLYQTLVHPRGGYLSNKLFVPSDVWKVKGARLKNVDEKVSNCDYLTTALWKLSQVDTCDADAVLEEMQSLESVFEQTQAALSRKLGNEVGPQSANALFKDASTGADNDTLAPGAATRNPAVSNQSRSFSWRRLRSKNSFAGLGSSYSATSNGHGVGSSGVASRKESESEASGKNNSTPLSSLPMTTQPTRRPAKRDLASARFSGPNAIYMDALARLFDAAQSIDQVARQVDDPGLRHADKTQVGLELCTRHAAEFFAFYICRFVLSDVSLLLEKFIKRGSEWVLA
ncbi:hypothetical protein SEPCBS119000_000340 [Sporothrix epigloea]|uniref:MIT domain-containing protein n=1 Tax=Sporothrix epigloea TaxID=1892477 RepID=A0ABP0D5L4_9PEZI